MRSRLIRSSPAFFREVQGIALWLFLHATFGAWLLSLYMSVTCVLSHYVFTCNCDVFVHLSTELCTFTIHIHDTKLTMSRRLVADCFFKHIHVVWCVHVLLWC